ncbi:MAG TPA: ComF family protein [Polyangiaceae bacterium]|nr:ComF family protein [Polyangiaceae bacterium]
MQLLERWLSMLLDVLAPPGCAACDTACPPQQPFCNACGQAACFEQAQHLDGLPLLVAARYRPPLSTAIVRFKYESRPELAAALARLVGPVLSSWELPASSALVPVPLHPRRLVTRGYNQAALLAQELSRSTGLLNLPRLLRRTREMERQVGKSREQRIENARDAFELRRPGPPNVVLVDDVITTGSTVRACAQALTAGGVRLAAVVAVARAESGADASPPRRGQGPAARETAS